MHRCLEGRTALILGATSGIGREVVRRFLSAGAHVAVHGSAPDRVDQLIQDLPDHDAVSRVVADIHSQAGRDSLREQLTDQPAILVAIGHGTTWGPIDNFTGQQLHDQLRTKPLSEIAVIQELLPGMTRQGWGRVTMVGGAEAVHAVPNYAAGMLSAALIRAAVKSLALDYSRSGVTFNAVHPGPTLTKRTEEFVAWKGGGLTLDEHLANHAAASATGRVTTAAEVADLILYLSSPTAGQVTGQSIVIDGGTGRSV